MRGFISKVVLLSFALLDEHRGMFMLLFLSSVNDRWQTKLTLAAANVFGAFMDLADELTNGNTLQ